MDGIFNFAPEFQAARFGDVRTHDCNYPARDVCDINAVFPRDDADPTDSANYDFARTDHYLQTIRETGCTITYRLGYTIDHHPVKRYCHPPRDFHHWAQVCVGIARHYNEGWANGFHNWVARWEIWNEPDNGTGPESPCWTGTLEEFIKLYEITARALKAQDPSCAVGGPGAGGVFSTKILCGLLDHCAATGTPLDFYSWHTYENCPEKVLELARHVRSCLDQAGFTATQSVLNEWHAGPNLEWGVLFCGHDPDRLRAKVEEMNGAAAASYTAATLLAMQDGPIDLANYYTGDNMACFGLFDQFGAPRVPYFAFLTFAALMQCPTQVMVGREGVPETTYAVAGRNDAGEVRIMVANDSPRPTMVRLAVNGGSPDWTLEQTRGWASINGEALTLPAHSFTCARGLLG